MKKIALLPLLAATFIMAGGDIDPVEPNIEMPAISEDVSVSSIPMSFGLIGGVLKGDGVDDWNPLYGVEFSFECLFSSSVRSQMQITNYDEDGIKMLQFSANPHYLFDIAKDTTFGVGPSLGVAQVEINDEDDTIFTYGLGASIRTEITEHFYVGAEARYEWTTDAEFLGEEDDFNNAKVFAKIGYTF
jgi:opacity protein-like surface antigen